MEILVLYKRWSNYYKHHWRGLCGRCLRRQINVARCTCGVLNHRVHNNIPPIILCLPLVGDHFFCMRDHFLWTWSFKRVYTCIYTHSIYDSILYSVRYLFYLCIILGISERYYSTECSVESFDGFDALFQSYGSNCM